MFKSLLSLPWFGMCATFVYVVCGIIVATVLPTSIATLVGMGVLIEGSHSGFETALNIVLWTILPFDIIMCFFIWGDKMTLNKVHCCKSKEKQSGEKRNVTGCGSCLRVMFCGTLASRVCLVILWALVAGFLYVCVMITVFATAVLVVYSVCETNEKINYDAITSLVAVIGIGPEAGSGESTSTVDKLTCPDNSSDLSTPGIQLFLSAPLMLLCQIVILASASTVFFMMSRVRSERARFHRKLRRAVEKAKNGDDIEEGGETKDDDPEASDDDLDAEEPADAAADKLKEQLQSQTDQITSEFASLKDELATLKSTEPPVTITQLQNELADLKLVLAAMSSHPTSHRNGRVRVRKSRQHDSSVSPQRVVEDVINGVLIAIDNRIERGYRYCQYARAFADGAPPPTLPPLS